MSESQKFIKTEEAEAVENLMEMDPLAVIKAAAEGIGLILNDPKPNCKKCHGQGYLGRNSLTKEPIPCTCIFPKYESQRPSEESILPQNRAQRRAAMKKISNKQAKQILNSEKKKD